MYCAGYSPDEMWNQVNVAIRKVHVYIAVCVCIYHCATLHTRFLNHVRLMLSTMLRGCPYQQGISRIHFVFVYEFVLVGTSLSW